MMEVTLAIAVTPKICKEYAPLGQETYQTSMQASELTLVSTEIATTPPTTIQTMLLRRDPTRVRTTLIPRVLLAFKMSGLRTLIEDLESTNSEESPSRRNLSSAVSSQTMPSLERSTNHKLFARRSLRPSPKLKSVTESSFRRLPAQFKLSR